MKINKEIIDKQHKKALVKEVYDDFENRRSERRFIEQQWKLNLNYLAGNQYCETTPNGDLKEEEKYYGWQNRSVFNHIAPIIDNRLAKLSKTKPIMSVRASGGEENDLKNAEITGEILNSTYQRLDISKIISKATIWSESCGTAFYKIMWNADKGKKIGEVDGKPTYEGDVEVCAVPPFEIFPDSIHHFELEDCASIIHAKAVHVDEVYENYGVKVKGETVDVFSLSPNKLGYNGKYLSKNVSSTLSDHTIVIERYERPNAKYKNGRLTIVAGGELLFEGELPYKNGVDGERDFPFVKQVSLYQAGAFFGVSIIERLIPLQRAYNAVKNRKYEFMNRVSMGVINVEDGSIDTDELADEGLSPGKIIVYRQGSRPPQMMASNSVPIDFTYEEERLSSEFVTISGTSEVSRSSDTLRSTMSGVALELLIEQDETRLSVTRESLNNAIKEMGKKIVRLYKEFAGKNRVMRSVGDGKSVKLFYFNNSDLSSDDVVLDTENELSRTPAQKKSAVLEMLSAGLLTDNGVINARTKAKILDILGYGSLDNTQDIVNLHRNKAEKENIDMLSKEVSVDDYDAHDVHIEEHMQRLLSEAILENKNQEYIERLKKHVDAHKELALKEQIANAVKAGIQNE